MTNLIEYIGQDYTYNIIDLDELHILRPDIFKIWSDFGFTSGLSEEDAIVCSNAFDAMLRYILNYNENTKVDRSDVEIIWNGKLDGSYYDEMFSTIAFPMIRRLQAYGVVLTPEQLHRLYNKLIPVLWRKSKEREVIYGGRIDVEAEATALLCQVISRRVKKNKKKRKVRRKNEKHKD